MTKREISRRKLSRREFLTLAGVSALGMRVAAPAAARAAAPAAPAVVGRAPKELFVGTGTDVTVVDARIAQSDSAKSQMTHVLEQMCWPDDSGKAQPILITAWEPVTNPPGWRFKLRSGIKFHNGEAWDGASLRYSVESILDDANKSWVNSDPRTRLSMVVSVKIEDPLTVFVQTKSFSRVLPLSLYRTFMLPAKYGAEKGKDFGNAPIGTGHYKFVEYLPKRYLRLERNPNYHGFWDGPARNSGITFKFLSENATRVAALEAGEVHVIDNLPPDMVNRIKNNPNLDALVVPTSRLMGLNFHNGRPPFNNLNARLAAAYGIDKAAIVKSIMNSMTVVGETPMASGTLGVEGEKFRPYPFDPARAKQYFKEAGLTNGTKIKMGGSVGRYINDKQVVTALASMVADIGFAPEIEQTEMSVYWPKVTSGTYDCFYAGYGTPAYDPDDLKATYTGVGDDNGGYTHFVEHNKRVLELYHLMDQTPDQAKAAQHAREFAHLLWNSVPIAQMFYEPNIVGVSKQVKGWKPRRDTMTYLWSAFLEEA
jgi:peptide/nickel transport system substrate-binding protein